MGRVCSDSSNTPMVKNRPLAKLGNRNKPLSIIFKSFTINEMEPVVGFEPTTDGLQNRCSTTELNWLLDLFPIGAMFIAALNPTVKAGEANRFSLLRAVAAAW